MPEGNSSHISHHTAESQKALFCSVYGWFNMTTACLKHLVSLCVVYSLLYMQHMKTCRHGAVALITALTWSLLCCSAARQSPGGQTAAEGG